MLFTVILASGHQGRQTCQGAVNLLVRALVFDVERYVYLLLLVVGELDTHTHTQFILHNLWVLQQQRTKLNI